MVPDIPLYTVYLDNHVTITIPLKQTGAFTVEGRIWNASYTAIVEFILQQTRVSGTRL
jgi:hypothetical protein